jgi:hypothetical protein
MRKGHTVAHASRSQLLAFDDLSADLICAQAHFSRRLTRELLEKASLITFADVERDISG